MTGIAVRRAEPHEAAALSALAVAAKASQGYDAATMAAFAAELTWSADYFASHEGWVAHEGERVLGWYSLDFGGDGAELDAMWVRPDTQGNGVGRALFDHAVARVAAAGATVLGIQADPFARGFYERMGAVYRRDTESASVPGRMLPFLELKVPR